MLILQKRLDALTRQLAARERTIGVLTARIEHSLNDEVSTVSVLHSNIALEQIVQNKTRELEQTYAALKDAQAEILHASKLTSIGQLAAGIAHEINTPIQYVSDNTHFLQKAFVSLNQFVVGVREIAGDAQTCPGVAERLTSAIKRSKLDYLVEETPRAIEQTVDGVHRVAEIVRAMKAFSHPSGGAKLPADLSECITTTATVARNAWKYVAELHTSFDPALPQIPCLRDELNQVILNLIVNAADAIAEKQGSTTTALGCIDITTRLDGDFAEVRVRDSGTGIPENIRARIFDPFFTTKSVGKGTGQGLAIAYNVIVDKHGGTVAVESEVGEGSTFVVRLPIASDVVQQ